MHHPAEQGRRKEIFLSARSAIKLLLSLPPSSSSSVSPVTASRASTCMERHGTAADRISMMSYRSSIETTMSFHHAGIRMQQRVPIISVRNSKILSAWISQLYQLCRNTMSLRFSRHHYNDPAVFEVPWFRECLPVATAVTNATVASPDA